MTKQTEAMKLALEALEVATTPFARDRQEVLRAQAALREALADQPAQPQQDVAIARDGLAAIAQIILDSNSEDENQAQREQWAVDKIQTALSEQPAQKEPVAWKWQQAPIRTAWGDDMVVASVAIDKDHTVDLYCERDQTPKVDAMFAQRTWVGLTDAELSQVMEEVNYTYNPTPFARALEAKLKEKNS